MQASASIGVAQLATVWRTSSKPNDAESLADASARNCSLSCARRRSVMSRTTAVNTRRPSGRSSFEIDASAGNSEPSRRRPATSRRCPIRRADSVPRANSSTKTSCRGRNRSGKSVLRCWPNASFADQPKISSAPLLKWMMRCESSTVITASAAIARMPANIASDACRAISSRSRSATRARTARWRYKEKPTAANAASSAASLSKVAVVAPPPRSRRVRASGTSRTASATTSAIETVRIFRSGIRARARIRGRAVGADAMTWRAAPA